MDTEWILERGQSPVLSDIASLSAHNVDHLSSEMCSSDDEETRFSDEEALSLYSGGESLRLSTRNFPQRTAAWNDCDDPAETKIDTDNLTTGEISDLYTVVGKTLSSPQVLAGIMNLAALFTKKAAELPHFYKNRGFVISLTVSLGLFCIFLSLTIIYSERLEGNPDIGSAFTCEIFKKKYNFSLVLKNFGDRTAVGFSATFDKAAKTIEFAYLLIPMIAPLLLTAFGIVFWTVLPACTRSLQLRSKLESMEPFLGLCELSNVEFNQLFYEEDLGVCDYKVVGSAGDGFGFFASQGSNKQPFERKAVLTQDIDLNIFMNTLSIKEEQLVRVPGAPGFTWIRLKQEEVDKLEDPVINNSLFNSAGSQDYFLSAAGISVEASKFFTQTESGDPTQIVEHFPALTLHTTAVGPNGNQEYEVDYAFAFRCPHWPVEASEWITRQRAGIDQTTINDISQRGCYLVHKPCGKDEFKHNHEFDWRFTFASAEADLFHYHSDKKALKLAYVILKFIIKMSTKSRGLLESSLFQGICGAFTIMKSPKELPVLRTYHLKTVFLWMAEEETELDMYRIKGNKDLGKVFMALLNRYYDCVMDRKLPNYFMRDRNMLSGSRYQETDFKQAIQLLKLIRMQPTYLIFKNFEREFVNKKALVGTIAVLFVLFSVIYLLRDVNDIWSNVSKANAWRDIIDDLNKPAWATEKYLTFLESLLGNTTVISI